MQAEDTGRAQGPLEPKGAPRVVEAIWIREPDITPGSAILRVPGLHPEDVLGHTGLNGNGQAPHTAGDAGNAVVSTPRELRAATTMA